MDNVVDGIVARNSSLAKLAAKTMSSQMSHILAAVDTHMGLADWCSNSQTHSNPDSVIRHAEAEGGDWWGIQPSTRFLRTIS